MLFVGGKPVSFLRVQRWYLDFTYHHHYSAWQRPVYNFGTALQSWTTLFFFYQSRILWRESAFAIGGHVCGVGVLSLYVRHERSLPNRSAKICEKSHHSAHGPSSTVHYFNFFLWSSCLSSICSRSTPTLPWQEGSYIWLWLHCSQSAFTSLPRQIFPLSDSYSF